MACPTTTTTNNNNMEIYKPGIDKCFASLTPNVCQGYRMEMDLISSSIIFNPDFLFKSNYLLILGLETDLCKNP